MRAYTVAAAALALDVPAKWLDNLLSRHDLPGSTRGRQGVRRRLSPEAVTLVAVAIPLARDLEIPARLALTLAQRLLAAPAGRHPVTPHLALTLDRAAIEAALGERLREAAEIVIPPRRGRPPRG